MSNSPSKTYEVTATVHATSAEPRVDEFVEIPEQRDGNVGLCFSGGGSRALAAAWGQMRGLHQLGLLGKARALSSVSGGSWATVPFTYLPKSISNKQFLGGFVADPHELRVTDLFTDNEAAVLDHMDKKSLGYVPTQDGMDIVALALQVPELLACGVPADRLWSHLIGKYVLEPFGLAAFDKEELPLGWFCADESMAQQILAVNKEIGDTYHTVRADDELPRPFHVINTSMFVRPCREPKTDNFEYLAPVQATPFFTGISSVPLASASSDTAVGGGGVRSFAFDSDLLHVLPSKMSAKSAVGDGPNEGAGSSAGDSSVVLRQGSPFTLADITGASSAAFAEFVYNSLHDKIKLDPEFQYWPIKNLRAPAGSTQEFADGGALENLGVAAMLRYQDVDNLIVFINSENKLEKGKIEKGKPKRGKNATVVVSDAIPPLFGLQPYAKPKTGKPGGYIPYPPITDPGTQTGASEYGFNKVLDPGRFGELIDGLWRASTKNRDVDSRARAGKGACLFLQKDVAVQANNWWGVQAGRSVNILWVYNNRASDWNKQLRDAVRLVVPPSFPWYSTASTHLSKVKVNLLAHFSAWVVADNASVFEGMFKGD